jgi:hypothetical protein
VNILEEADSLINGERQQQYGSATESHERIADLWSAYLGNAVSLTALDVVLMMNLLKVSRAKGGLIMGQFHRDSFVDGAGYLGLGERIYDELNPPTDDEPTSYIAGLPPTVYEVTNPELDEPRVWQSVSDIPSGVTVKDRDGDLQRREGPGDDFLISFNHGLVWEKSYRAGESFAPFTEVLEPHE